MLARWQKLLDVAAITVVSYNVVFTLICLVSGDRWLFKDAGFATGLVALAGCARLADNRRQMAMVGLVACAVFLVWSMTPLSR